MDQPLIQYTFSTVPTPEDRNDITIAIPKGLREEWYLPSRGIHLERPTDWRVIKRGDRVIIPLCPYLVSTDGPLAMGYMFQLAARMCQDFSHIARLHLAIGDTIHPRGDGTMRYFLGVAVLPAQS